MSSLDKASLKAYFKIYISTIINLLSAFLRNKFSAIILGVAGIGILSQFINFINLLIFLLPLGLPLGLTKILSEKGYTNDEMKKLLSDSFVLLGASCIVFILILTIFAKYFSFLLLDTYIYDSYIILIAFFVPSIIFYHYFEAYLKSLKNINLIVKISNLSGISTIIVSIPLIIYFKMYGAIACSILNFTFYIFYSYIFLKKELLFPKIHLKFKFNKNFKTVFKIGLVFLLGGIISQLTLLCIRKINIYYFGLYGNGLYQSVISISSNYFIFIFAGMTTYVFPRLAAAKNNSEIISETNTTYKYIILIMVPLIILFIVLKKILIIFLFSRDFLEAFYLFDYQMFGDFYKALAWSFGLWLIPQMKIKVWILLEIIFNINFISILLLMLNIGEPDILMIPKSYLFSYIIHFVLNIFVIIRYLNYRIETKKLKIFLLVNILILLNIYLNKINYLGYIIVIPSIFVFYYFSLEKNDIVLFKKGLLNFKKKIYG